MNAKKKNKKAHKPPNPNPPLNVENVSKVEENIKVEKSEVKEAPVPKPEIISEVIEEAVSVDIETGSETPKKPKRNKGKKKHQDGEVEVIENVQVKQKEPQSESSNIQEQKSVPVSKEKGDEGNKTILDESSVVPSTRKKKNKKKTQDKLTEEPQTPDETSLPAHKELVTEVVETIAEKVTDIQELLSAKSETPKHDAKKKKNKKKNRNDSERSDKSESAVSCTSAFQNLLVDDTPTQEAKTESLKKISVDLVQDSEEKSVVKPKPLEDISQIDTHDAEDIKKNTQDEGKSKKKNKKDKKQLQQDIAIDVKPDAPQETSIIQDEKSTKGAISNEPDKDIKESIEVSLPIKKESSPRPKAKVAKPVEKKKQGNDDTQSSYNLSYSEILDFQKEPSKISEPPKDTEIKLEATPFDVTKEAHSTDIITTKETDIIKTIENISVPSENTMGKKRKKSPKAPKIKEEHLYLPQQESDIVSEVKECAKTIISDLTQTDINIVTKEASSIIPKAASEAMLKSQEHPILDTPEINLSRRSRTPETKKGDVVFETSTSKKKKKTPKVPQKEVASEVKEPIIPIIQHFEDKVDKSKQRIDEKIDFPQEFSFPADIDMRSVKTDESEASTCDAIPDVLFIRSSSQQLFDNNNNTIIQELMQVEEIKLNDPLLIPLIEGSGETPSRTPELITSGIKIIELEPKKTTEEKTDIKSKMMEVNQDMEELRLSIERSLAEFTAIEKSEQKIEKEYKSEKTLHSKDDNVEQKENQPRKPKELSVNPEKREDIPMEISTSAIPSTPLAEVIESPEPAPVCPARKDNKGKSKSKKKGKQEITHATTTASSESTTAQSKDNKKDDKQEKTDQKSDNKSESTKEKGKQQSMILDDEHVSTDTYKNDRQLLNSESLPETTEDNKFEPIEKFEDALTSSVDDVNKTFEIIAKEVDDDNVESQKKLAANKPEINITEATEDRDKTQNEKVHPVSQPKNLLGQTDIPVQSNRTDYKKEKNKTPNARQARVKIKDSMDVEKKQCKESQTDIKRARKNSDKSVKESFSKVKSDSEEYVYKYSFRKVFLQSACHVCNKNLSQVRVPCGYCNLLFYCGARHKDEDWPQHQALCFAVSTLAHMKDQKHIYADSQNTIGQDYRLLRMQMIVSCEKILKRRLVPWEQEAMLYPRLCADVSCREWRQEKLKDCDGCGQLSHCAANPSHLPKSHARWCKSYSLYQKLVCYQQTKGRLEPKLPTKVLNSEMAPKINEVLASIFEEKIDMNDIQYAALTQLATAPLTTSYCLQLCRKASGITNGVHKRQPFTIHVVGAELQFEADALNKWETFFLHLRPDIDELKVALVSPMLNPGNLPLDLLGRIKLCDHCNKTKRRVVFKFEDNKNYHEYRTCDDFINPDIICAFNPSIQRSSVYNGKDPWPATINCILKLKQPFIITSYTLNELRKDIARIKQVADIDFKLILEPGFNNFASVRPDRNFISDDEMPLLFKNYCVAVVLGC